MSLKKFKLIRHLSALEAPYEALLLLLALLVCLKNDHLNQIPDVFEEQEGPFKVLEVGFVMLLAVIGVFELREFVSEKLLPNIVKLSFHDIARKLLVQQCYAMKMRLKSEVS